MQYELTVIAIHAQHYLQLSSQCIELNRKDLAEVHRSVAEGLMGIFADESWLLLNKPEESQLTDKEKLAVYKTRAMYQRLKDKHIATYGALGYNAHNPNRSNGTS